MSEHHNLIKPSFIRQNNTCQNDWSHRFFSIVFAPFLPTMILSKNTNSQLFDEVSVVAHFLRALKNRAMKIRFLQSRNLNLILWSFIDHRCSYGVWVRPTFDVNVICHYNRLLRMKEVSNHNHHQASKSFHPMILPLYENRRNSLTHFCRKGSMIQLRWGERYEPNSFL